ncbi:hypothetical protein HDU82_002328 [Entophlyctis luteolus]|nr:hypothetical protein HDU82_002328 [Entophlyctis luteolus]
MSSAPASVDIPLRSDSLRLVIDTTIPRPERLSSNTISTNSNRSSVRAELASASTVDSVDRPKPTNALNAGLPSPTGSLRTLEQLSKGNMILNIANQTVRGPAKTSPVFGWSCDVDAAPRGADAGRHNAPLLDPDVRDVTTNRDPACGDVCVSGPTHNPDGSLTALSWSLKFPDEPLMMVWLRAINRITGRVGTAAFRRNRSATEGSGSAAAAALANLRVLGITGSSFAGGPTPPVLAGTSAGSVYVSPHASVDGTGMPLLSRSATVSGSVRLGKDESRLAKMQEMRNEYVNLQLKANAEKFKKAEALNQKLREYEIQDQVRRSAAQQNEAKKKEERAVKIRGDAIQKTLLPIRAPVNSASHSMASPGYNALSLAYEMPSTAGSDGTSTRFAPPQMTDNSPLPSPGFRDSMSSNGSATASRRADNGGFETLELLQKSNLTHLEIAKFYTGNLLTLIPQRVCASPPLRHRAFFVLSMDARLYMFADYILTARAQACLNVRESVLGGTHTSSAAVGTVLRVKGMTRAAISGAVAAATGATSSEAEWTLLFNDEETRAVWMRAIGRAVNNAVAAEAAAAAATAPGLAHAATGASPFARTPLASQSSTLTSSPVMSSAALRQLALSADDVANAVRSLTSPLPPISQSAAPEMSRKLDSARAAKMRLEYQEYLERQRSDDLVRRREQAFTERLAREELERLERQAKEERERELKAKAEGIRRAMKMI